MGNTQTNTPGTIIRTEEHSSTFSNCKGSKVIQGRRQLTTATPSRSASSSPTFKEGHSPLERSKIDTTPKRGHFNYNSVRDPITGKSDKVLEISFPGRFEATFHTTPQSRSNSPGNSLIPTTRATDALDRQIQTEVSVHERIEKEMNETSVTDNSSEPRSSSWSQKFSGYAHKLGHRIDKFLDGETFETKDGACEILEYSTDTADSSPYHHAEHLNGSLHHSHASNHTKTDHQHVNSLGFQVNHPHLYSLTPEQEVANTLNTGVITLTPAECKAIRRTWRYIIRSPQVIGCQVFTLIFKHTPEIKDIFPTFVGKSIEQLQSDTVFKSHSKRFIFSIRSLVENVHDLKSAASLMEALGKLHQRFPGFRPQYWNLFKDCIMKVWAKEMGDDFTPEVRAAWELVIGLMIIKMREGYESK